MTQIEALRADVEALKAIVLTLCAHARQSEPPLSTKLEALATSYEGHMLDTLLTDDQIAVAAHAIRSAASA